MIPVPGETAGEWWANVDAVAERERAADASGYSRDFDLTTYFLHDVPPEVAAEGEPFQRPEAEIAFTQPCDFTAWPRSQFACSPVLTIGSSRLPFSAGSPSNGLG
jgi:hypothetical protein